MVKKVNPPEEYSLLVHGRRNYVSHARKSLVAMSLEQMLKTKIVTKNFKAGFEFYDVYMAKASHNKLGRMLVSQVFKEVSYINFTNTEEEDKYIDCDPRQTWVKLMLINDPSILRYIRMLNNQISAVGLPYTLIATPVTNPDGNLNGKLRVYLQPVSVPQSFYYYKSMFFIDQFLAMMRTLARKAYFNDPALRVATQSSRLAAQGRTGPVNVQTDRNGTASHHDATQDVQGP